MGKEVNKSFVFFESWYDVLETEKPEIQWEVIHGIMEYVFRGNLVELKPQAGMAFKFIKRDIDRTIENRNDKIEKSRENGKKGGNPNFKKGQSNPYYNKGKDNLNITEDNLNITEDNQTLSKINYNVNVNDNVNDISFFSKKKKQKKYISDEGEILENENPECENPKDENPNADLKTEETLSKSFAKKFSLIWDLFKGKKNSFEKDYIKFLKKTEGLEIDFEKLQEEAHKARDIYFQSWLNQIFPKPSKGEETFDFHKALLNAGFDPELSDEWLKIRKVKNAVNSELAFKNFMREVKKSGRNPNEVLSIVVQKQWRGFEASWLHNEQFTDKQRAINYETTSTVTADEPKFGRATKSVIEQSLRGWE